MENIKKKISSFKNKETCGFFLKYSFPFKDDDMPIKCTLDRWWITGKPMNNYYWFYLFLSIMIMLQRYTF